MEHTDWKQLLDVLVGLQQLYKNAKEVFFTSEELWHNADHVNVAIIAVGLETVAAEYFEPVLRRQLFVAMVSYPLVDNLFEFFNSSFLLGSGVDAIIVVLFEYLLDDPDVAFVDFEGALQADGLVGSLEFVEVFVGR